VSMDGPEMPSLPSHDPKMSGVSDEAACTASCHVPSHLRDLTSWATPALCCTPYITWATLAVLHVLPCPWRPSALRPPCILPASSPPPNSTCLGQSRVIHNHHPRQSPPRFRHSLVQFQLRDASPFWTLTLRLCLGNRETSRFPRAVRRCNSATQKSEHERKKKRKKK
ncbi:hypothetical protein IWX48DRAFT_612612, partial [Phyllosticta citricarpa]